MMPPPELRQVQIGAYEVLFELAQGGMGTVYLARALGVAAGASGFERLVAIKRLHLHLLGQADSVGRFLEEAKVAAHIHHANVVGIHQIGSDEAGHFLVQDYVEGDTLQGLIDYATVKRSKLPPPVVLRIALDALAGLHAVHEARDASGAPLGILHRDVSTQNLLVGRDGVTRLADFGIAKHAQSSVVTDAQYLQGRVLYMPPEYLARAPIDRRFDLYGVGVTLFIALTGAVPWEDASDAQIVHLATTTGIPRLSEAGLAIAPAIEAIVARACERDPTLRYATARAMLDAVEDVGRHTGWIASHGEVADVVEQLAGRELAARRALLAHSPRSSRTREQLSPEGAVTPTGITRPIVGSAPSPAASRSRLALPLVAVGLVVGGAAIGVGLSLKRGPVAPSAPSAPAPLAVALPSPSASVAPRTPSSTESAQAPASSVAPPVASVTRVTKARARSEAAVSPSSINTSNPYR